MEATDGTYTNGCPKLRTRSNRHEAGGCVVGPSTAKGPIRLVLHQRINREPPTPRSLIVVHSTIRHSKSLAGQTTSGRESVCIATESFPSHTVQPLGGASLKHIIPPTWWDDSPENLGACVRCARKVEKSIFCRAIIKAGGHDRNPKDKTYGSTTTPPVQIGTQLVQHRPILDSTRRLDQDPSRGISSSTKRPRLNAD